jgi:N-acetylmuramoyl-L-alanine amidase
MKIVVLNFRKYKCFFTFTKLCAIFALLFFLTSYITNAYLTSEKYTAVLQNMNEKRLIIIDAGHGGEDPGAVGVGNVYEKNLNLELSFTLGKLLEEAGFAVLFTRTEDKLLYLEEENIKGIRKISDLKNRCKIAAEYPNSIFISIHMNSYSNPKYSGLQVYYSEKNENSKTLANKIQYSVKEKLQPSNNRTTKAGNGIYVLENLENTAVLIECGFITNPEECKKLLEKEYQKQLCLSIVYGIIDYNSLPIN